jgi:hypothetical protein
MRGLLQPGPAQHGDSELRVVEHIDEASARGQVALRECVHRGPVRLCTHDLEGGAEPALRRPAPPGQQSMLEKIDKQPRRRFARRFRHTARWQALGPITRQCLPELLDDPFTESRGPVGTANPADIDFQTIETQQLVRPGSRVEDGGDPRVDHFMQFARETLLRLGRGQRRGKPELDDLPLDAMTIRCRHRLRSHSATPPARFALRRWPRRARRRSAPCPAR